MFNIIFRPSNFFVLNWLFLFAVNSSIEYFYPIFYPLDSTVYFYIFTVFISVKLGGVVANFIPIKILRNLAILPRWLVSAAFDYRVWIFILIFHFLATSVERQIMIGSNWFTPDGINAYRYLVTEGGERRLFSALNYLNFFIFFSGAYLVYFSNNIGIKEKLLFILVIVSLLYINSARSTAFVVILITFFSYFLINKFRFWLILTPFILIITFILIGSISGKDDSFSLVSYYIAPIHAFSELFVNAVPFGEEYQLLSFRFLHNFFVALGLIDSPALMLPYVETPFPTNVYTVFFVYWYDLGWFSLLFWFYFGLSADFVYRWFLNVKNFSSVALLSLILNCIVLSVFYDYFTSSAFVYIGTLILLLLNTNLKKHPSSRKLCADL